MLRKCDRRTASQERNLGPTTVQCFQPAWLQPRRAAYHKGRRSIHRGMRSRTADRMSSRGRSMRGHSMRVAVEVGAGKQREGSWRGGMVSFVVAEQVWAPWHGICQIVTALRRRQLLLPPPLLQHLHVTSTHTQTRQIPSSEQPRPAHLLSRGPETKLSCNSSNAGASRPHAPATLPFLHLPGLLDRRRRRTQKPPTENTARGKQSTAEKENMAGRHSEPEKGQIQPKVDTARSGYSHRSIQKSMSRVKASSTTCSSCSCSCRAGARVLMLGARGCTGHRLRVCRGHRGR